MCALQVLLLLLLLLLLLHGKPADGVSKDPSSMVEWLNGLCFCVHL